MRAFVVLGLVFSIPSQEIGLGKRLRNDLFCVEWDVKPKLSQSVMLWLAGGASRVPASAAGISEPHPDECRSDDIYEDLCALRRRSAFFKVASDATNGR